MCTEQPCPQRNPWLEARNRDFLRMQRNEQMVAGIYDAYPRRLFRDRNIGKLTNGDYSRSSRSIDNFTHQEAKRARNFEYPIVPYLLQHHDDGQELGIVQVYPTSGEAVRGSKVVAAYGSLALGTELIATRPFDTEQIQLLGQHAMQLAKRDLIPLVPDIQWLQLRAEG